MLYLLPHVVDNTAQRNPDHPAIRFDDQTLTYAQFAEQTNQLAHVLIDQGVRRGDRVGIYVHKSLASAVAIYGIMKAGAAYVPLDPTAPPVRTGYALQDCGIRHLITERSKLRGLAKLQDEGTTIDCLIGIEPDDTLSARALPWSQVAQASTATPDTGTTELDLAYIMYTSGSTGTPKGIMHTHHSGLSYAYWAAHEYGMTPDDRLTNHAPLHFDLSTFDFFGAAVVGATTVIVPEEVPKLPASYTALLAKERITIFFTVPFALIQLLTRGALDKHDLSHLRWICFGGEPFPTKHLRALMAQLPNTHFSNIYGPAEVNGVTFYHVPELPEGSDDPIPIGRVCPNVQGLVVDADDNPVAPGDPGELLIRSPTMMQGYWQRPDLNAKAFYRRTVTDTYDHVYYRTGDLVRENTDGDYDFLGRKDRQVKTRGYRVELDEVEAALVAHEQVEEAAVFAVADSEGTNQIRAAVIAKPDAELTTNNLIKHAAARLPWYAVPVRIEVMENFPRTTSGKIDRRALAEQAAT